MERDVQMDDVHERMMDAPRIEERWHLHSAGSKGVTFHSDFVDSDDIDGALEAFKQTMRPAMDAWPITVSRMSVTLS